MKLYYFPGACSLADHIVLEWIGAPYETIRMNRDSIKSQQYLALNPNGAVPLLVDGDFVLSQNGAILFYLGDRYPDARLLGDGTSRGRADVLRWVCLLNSDVHPAYKPLLKAAHPDPAVAGVLADSARNLVRQYLDRLDARLHGRDWLAGERSIADPYLFVLLRWAIRFEIDASGLVNLAAFLNRMYSDSGVRAAVIAEEGSIDERAWLRT